MIEYESDGAHFLLNLFKVYGSVFPKALRISVPASLLTGVLVSAIYDFNVVDYFKDPNAVMNNNAIWGGFSSLVGFLVVFRTSQAYSRFWEGCTSTHKMGAEWFDSCAALMAFCKASTADEDHVLNFQNTLIRLFSMLHAAALGEIEDCGERQNYANVSAFRMELIDGMALDEETLRSIRDSDAKVELIFVWIQQLIVENIKTGVLSIAPPILTRSFQEIANGMVHFHDALKISNVPFPFPYAQTCDCLLVLHWLIVHFVVSQWCQQFYWAILFTFIQVFTLWSLNFIAVELENPFGTDPNDIDGTKMQLQMNNQLRLLLRASTMHTPSLKFEMGMTQIELANRVIDDPADNKLSFFDLWEQMCPDDDQVTTPRRFQVRGRYKEFEKRRSPSVTTTIVYGTDDLNHPGMLCRKSAGAPRKPGMQRSGSGFSGLSGPWEPCGQVDAVRRHADDGTRSIERPVDGGNGRTSTGFAGAAQGDGAVGRQMSEDHAHHSQSDDPGVQPHLQDPPYGMRGKSKVTFKQASTTGSGLADPRNTGNATHAAAQQEAAAEEHGRGREPQGMAELEAGAEYEDDDLASEHEIPI